jgi:hypothetical protein
MIFDYTKQGEITPMETQRFDTIEEAVLHTKGLHLLTGSKTRLFKRQDVVIDGKQYYLHIGLY